VWSRPNKQRVARLAELGLLRPAGRDAIDRAMADGSWSLLDGPENLEVPDARASFDAFCAGPPVRAGRGLGWSPQAQRCASDLPVFAPAKGRV